MVNVAVDKGVGASHAYARSERDTEIIDATGGCKHAAGMVNDPVASPDRGDAWRLRRRSQYRAVGVTATTKKCLKGIASVRFTPKMRVYAVNCVTSAQRNFLPGRLHGLGDGRRRGASPDTGEAWPRPYFCQPPPSA